MGKKFCIAILSIILLSGVTIMSQELLAAPISKLEIEQITVKDYYINEDITFHVSTQNNQGKVLYVSGGNVVGNSDEYTIPLQENSSDFTLKNITKPGVYQGSVDSQVSYSERSEVESVTSAFSFTLYGKAFQQEQFSLTVKDEVTLPIYGSLPSNLTNPKIQYTSHDETIATIDETGFVKALKSGSTTMDVEVFDEQGTMRSKSSCEVLVSEQEQDEVSFEKAIPGEEYEYRFVEMGTLYEGDTKDKLIGSLHLGQSGAHTYYVAQENEDTLSIEDGDIRVKKDLEKDEYESVVYVRHEESKKLYKISVEYRVQEKVEQVETNDFSFRYNGSDVKQIKHAYQAGANSFQISSNQAISDVSFQLKEEGDSAYFTISQTGNVTIKKITDKPVIIKATWKKQTYELPVMIEKAEQLISQDVHHMRINIDDGAFEPIINGCKGTGTLVLSSKDSTIASTSMNMQNQMSIQPKAVGKTTIEVYNNGDENYKKSNVLRFEVEVVQEQSDSVILQAQNNWLLYPETQEGQTWYKEDVEIAINPNIESISEFSYQGEWMKEVILSENGVRSIPFTFRSEIAGSESNALMLQVAIDTHAPIISRISENPVADNPIKEFINLATFQKSFGTGMKISIEASDYLMDKDIEVSGVASIAYKIYAVEDDKEELLVDDQIRVENDKIEVVVDDTRVHKVCASAIDVAGLSSIETCSLLDNNVVQIRSKNSGIMLKARGLSTNSNLEVTDVLEEVLADDIFLAEDVEVQAALKLDIDAQIDKTMKDEYAIVIPIRTQDEGLASGTWKQQLENGSYEDVIATYEEGTCTITTSSLNTLIYVQDANKKSDLQSFKLANNSKSSTTPQTNNVVNLASRTSDFDIEEVDTTIFLCIGGGMMALLFAIILIRANHDENYD